MERNHNRKSGKECCTNNTASRCSCSNCEEANRESPNGSTGREKRYATITMASDVARRMQPAENPAMKQVLQLVASIHSQLAKPAIADKVGGRPEDWEYVVVKKSGVTKIICKRGASKAKIVSASESPARQLVQDKINSPEHDQKLAYIFARCPTPSFRSSESICSDCRSYAKNQSYNSTAKVAKPSYPISNNFGGKAKSSYLTSILSPKPLQSRFRTEREGCDKLKTKCITTNVINQKPFQSRFRTEHQDVCSECHSILNSTTASAKCSLQSNQPTPKSNLCSDCQSFISVKQNCPQYASTRSNDICTVCRSTVSSQRPFHMRFGNTDLCSECQSIVNQAGLAKQSLAERPSSQSKAASKEICAECRLPFKPQPTTRNVNVACRPLNNSTGMNTDLHKSANKAVDYWVEEKCNEGNIFTRRNLVKPQNQLSFGCFSIFSRKGNYEPQIETQNDLSNEYELASKEICSDYNPDNKQEFCNNCRSALDDAGICSSCKNTQPPAMSKTECDLCLCKLDSNGVCFNCDIYRAAASKEFCLNCQSALDAKGFCSSCKNVQRPGVVNDKCDVCFCELDSNGVCNNCKSKVAATSKELCHYCRAPFDSKGFCVYCKNIKGQGDSCDVCSCKLDSNGVCSNCNAHRTGASNEFCHYCRAPFNSKGFCVYCKNTKRPGVTKDNCELCLCKLDSNGVCSNCNTQRTDVSKEFCHYCRAPFDSKGFCFYCKNTKHPRVTKDNCEVCLCKLASNGFCSNCKSKVAATSKELCHYCRAPFDSKGFCVYCKNIKGQGDNCDVCSCKLDSNGVCSNCNAHRTGASKEDFCHYCRAPFNSKGFCVYCKNTKRPGATKDNCDVCLCNLDSNGFCSNCNSQGAASKEFCHYCRAPFDSKGFCVYCKNIKGQGDNCDVCLCKLDANGFCSNCNSQGAASREFCHYCRAPFDSKGFCVYCKNIKGQGDSCDVCFCKLDSSGVCSNCNAHRTAASKEFCHYCRAPYDSKGFCFYCKNVKNQNRTAASKEFCHYCRAPFDAKGFCFYCKNVKGQGRTAVSKEFCHYCRAPFDTKGFCFYCKNIKGQGMTRAICDVCLCKLDSNGFCFNCDTHRTVASKQFCYNCRSVLDAKGVCSSCKYNQPRTVRKAECDVCFCKLDSNGVCFNCEIYRNADSKEFCKYCRVPFDAKGFCFYCKNLKGQGVTKDNCDVCFCKLDSNGFCSNCNTHRTSASKEFCHYCRAPYDAKGFCFYCKNIKGQGMARAICDVCLCKLDPNGLCFNCDFHRFADSKELCKNCRSVLDATGACSFCVTFQPIKSVCNECQCALNALGFCDNCNKYQSISRGLCNNCNSAVNASGLCVSCAGTTFNPCSCKVCECLNQSRNKNTSSTAANSCQCKPCDCPDCTKESMKRSGCVFTAYPCIIQHNDSCSCKPCSCMKCTRPVSTAAACDCEPCNCVLCAKHKTDSLVAPVGIANGCSCTPCQCASCRMNESIPIQRSRHEISTDTAIFRHADCLCDDCVVETCQSLSPGNCLCARKNKIMKKPFGKTSNDFDIRMVTVNPQDIFKNKKQKREYATFAALTNNLPTFNNNQLISSENSTEKGTKRSSKTNEEHSSRNVNLTPVTNSFSSEYDINKSHRKFAGHDSSPTASDDSNVGIRGSNFLFSCRFSEVRNSTSTLTNLMDELENQQEIENTKQLRNCKRNICTESLNNNLQNNSCNSKDYETKTSHQVTHTSSYTNDLPTKDNIGGMKQIRRSNKIPTTDNKSHDDYVPIQRSDKRHYTPSKQLLNSEPCNSQHFLPKSHLAHHNEKLNNLCKKFHENNEPFYKLKQQDTKGIHTDLRTTKRAVKSKNNDNVILKKLLSEDAAQTSAEHLVDRILDVKVNNQTFTYNKPHKDVPVFKTNDEDLEIKEVGLSETLTQSYKNYSAETGKWVKENDSTLKRIGIKIGRENKFLTTNIQTTPNWIQDYKKAQTMVESVRAFSSQLVNILELFESINAEFQTVSSKINGFNGRIYSDLHKVREFLKYSNIFIPNEMKFFSPLKSEHCRISNDGNMFIYKSKEDLKTSQEDVNLKHVSFNNKRQIIIRTYDNDEYQKQLDEIKEITLDVPVFNDTYDQFLIYNTASNTIEVVEVGNHVTFGELTSSNERLALEPENFGEAMDITNSSYDHKEKNVTSGNCRKLSFNALNDFLDPLDTKIDLNYGNFNIYTSLNMKNIHEEFQDLLKYNEIGSDPASAVVASINQSSANHCVSCEEKIYQEFHKDKPVNEGKDNCSDTILKQQSLNSTERNDVKVKLSPVLSMNENLDNQCQDNNRVDVVCSKLAQTITRKINLRDAIISCTTDPIPHQFDDYKGYKSFTFLRKSSHDFLNFVSEGCKTGPVTCECLKVPRLEVRKVSSRTVVVKWEKPAAHRQVQGYELLVDGKAVNKSLGPSACMAVLTCLPQSEKVLITVKTMPKVRDSDHHPSSTVVYCPRVYEN